MRTPQRPAERAPDAYRAKAYVDATPSELKNVGWRWTLFGGPTGAPLCSRPDPRTHPVG
jgi:hypothetical protein